MDVIRYVWPENLEECTFASCYSPALHLERGELFAVVRPKDLADALAEIARLRGALEQAGLATSMASVEQIVIDALK